MDHGRADLQEPEPDRVATGAGHVRAEQSEAADGVEQRVGQPGEEQPELVRQPFRSLQ